MFRYTHCIPDLSKTFVMKGCWILSKDFSASGEMIMCFLFFFSVCVYVDYIGTFLYVELPLHLWNEAYLIMGMIFLMYSWILFAFLKFFIYGNARNWSVILFLFEFFVVSMLGRLFPHKKNLEIVLYFIF